MKEYKIAAEWHNNWKAAERKLAAMKAERDELKENLKRRIDLQDQAARCYNTLSDYKSKKLYTLTAKLKKAVDALEFYGNKNNWVPGHGGEYESRIELDSCGNVARRTLAELRGGS